MILEVTHISKSYKNGTRNLAVLSDISFSVDQGEIITIMGPSGSGKSTLMNILGTLDKADKGTVRICDKKTDNLDDRSLAELRNKHIGFVFQFHHLLPEFTALENICIPAYIAKSQKKEILEKAKYLLSIMDIENRANHKPNELSGGEQQRISVARALINDPKIILADEPSGNLDTNTAQELHELFFKLREDKQQTFIIVTHNQNLAQLADRKITMKDGEIL